MIENCKISICNYRPVYKTYLVICGNWQEFKVFCKSKMDDYTFKDDMEYEGCEFVYYSNPSCIYGYRFDGVLTYGTYNNRNDIDWLDIECRMIR